MPILHILLFVFAYLVLPIFLGYQIGFGKGAPWFADAFLYIVTTVCILIGMFIKRLI